MSSSTGCTCSKEFRSTLVNGRYDLIYPPLFAFRVNEKLPGSNLIIVERSGYSMGELEIEKALLDAVREFE